MDTRTKITTPHQARARLANSPHIAYRAGFDVLTAARIQSLRQVAQPGTLLIAVIEDQPNSLLATQARAELAASLAIIDLVVIGPFPTPNLIDDTEADARHTAELIQHVHRRNRHD